MQWRLLVLFLFVSTMVAACGSQNGSSGGDGSVVLNGCKVDPARICNSVKGQNVTVSNTGLEADPRMVEQNSERTANIFLPVNRPNGDEIFEVECGMNTLNQSVSWAHIKTGPPVTDDDVKYLRGAGYCVEP
jgi:hypothetical protein